MATTRVLNHLSGHYKLAGSMVCTLKFVKVGEGGNIQVHRTAFDLITGIHSDKGNRANIRPRIFRDTIEGRQWLHNNLQA